MRIALIAEIDTLGGTRTYCKQLIRLLRSQGADVCALVQGPENDAEFVAFAREQGVEWQRLPAPRGCFSRAGARQVWELAALVPPMLRYRPDIVIVSVGTPGTWLTPFLLPVPAVHILHTVVSAPRRLLRPCLALLLSRLSAKRRLATVSSYAVEQIKRHWRSDARCIYNCTPYPDAVSLPSRSAPGKRVITAGHVTAYKNPQVWLNVAQRVLARHPSASFFWYGEGPMLETMRNQAKGLPGVCFCGSLPDMRAAYAEAAVYFQPSLVENHSIAVLEAMSYGLPCVVSDRGGSPESVSHGETGYVGPADDAEFLADCTCSLLENHDLAARLGEAGREKVAARYMPGHWSKNIMALLEECLRGK